MDRGRTLHRLALALGLLLALSACGNRSSQQDLEARVAELEDQNDLLKQQLADARLQAEEAMVAAERAKTTVSAYPPLPMPLAPEIPPDLAIDGPDNDHETADTSSRARSHAGSSAAADAAAEAAETAREALGR